jgi:hypothetical protein
MATGPRTVDLVLQYRLQLVRCEPDTQFHLPGGAHCDGDGIVHDLGQFHLDRWEDREWLAYRENFVAVIQRFWDRKFELTPNRPWYRPPGAHGSDAATITCGLTLALVDAAAQAHQRYWIIKPRDPGFRSSADPVWRVGLFTHQDLSPSRDTTHARVGHARHSVSFLQTTVLHEFGHTLGLDHVNGPGDADWNYGVTLEQREDIMGWGDHVTAREARPWISQLRRHLIPGHDPHDASLRFAGRVIAPQIISYWDNDWVPPAPASHHPHHTSH